MNTGHREGDGWRAGQRGSDPNLECGCPMSGTSHFTSESISITVRRADTRHNLLFSTNIDITFPPLTIYKR